MKNKTMMEIQGAVSGLKETVKGIKMDKTVVMGAVKNGVQMMTAAAGDLVEQGEKYKEFMKKAGK